jgi:hypothetical protein
MWLMTVSDTTWLFIICFTWCATIMHKTHEKFYLPESASSERRLLWTLRDRRLSSSFCFSSFSFSCNQASIFCLHALKSRSLISWCRNLEDKTVCVSPVRHNELISHEIKTKVCKWMLWFILSILFNDAVSWDYVASMIPEWRMSMEYWWNVTDKGKLKY